MKITDNTISLIGTTIASHNVWAARTRKALNVEEHEQCSKIMLRTRSMLRGMMDMLNTMDANNSYRLEFSDYGMYANIEGIIKTSTTGKESYIIKR